MNTDTEDGLRTFVQGLLKAWDIPPNTGSRVHYWRAKTLLRRMDFDHGQYHEAMEIVKEWLHVDEP